MKKNTSYIFNTNFSLTSILLVLLTFVFYIITPIVANAQYYDYGYDNSYDYTYGNSYNYGYDNSNYTYGYDNTYNYGYDNSYNYGYDNSYNYTYDNSNYTYGYDNTYNYGYDNSYNYTYDNSNYTYGYDNTYDYGYDNTYDYGYDNSTYNYGYDNSNYTYGYDNTYDYGYDNTYDYGYDNTNYSYGGTYYDYVDSTYNYGYYSTPTYIYSYETTPIYTYGYTNIGYDSCITCRPPATPTKTRPNLTASCYVNPSAVDVNGYLNWSASASGGTGFYTYTWTGTNGLSSNSSSVSKSYSSAGTKTGTVVVTSGGQSVSRTCSAVVEQKINNNLSVYCNASQSNLDIDEDVTWRAYASGGTGSYSYNWDGTDYLRGSNQNLTWSYDNSGTKRATITVTSGGQVASASCTTRVADDYNNLNISCYASPSNSQIGNRVNWYVNASGGDGDYSYNWSGTDGLNSSSRSPSMTYNTVGTKSATVTVRDQDGNRDSVTCYTNINSVLAFTQEYQPPMASAVYLSQVPYTGVADSMKLYFFFGVLALLSAWIAYIIIEYKRGAGEFEY